MENIRESQSTKHEQVILFGLSPLCAKRIIPGMSPALAPCAKRDQELPATRSEASCAGRLINVVNHTDQSLTPPIVRAERSEARKTSANHNAQNMSK